jgi:hypothetical protein
MSCKSLIYGIVLSIVVVQMSNAQVPTLDALQTVNTATGEMQFSLPLATVTSVNGHNFNVDLGYQAGIPYHQQASAVGLGFSYGAGAITRQVVYMPDNNSYVVYADTTFSYHCEETLWERLEGLRFGITATLTLLTGGTGAGAAIMALHNYVQFILNNVPGLQKYNVMTMYQQIGNITRSSVTGSGSHIPDYNRRGRGLGFFKESGISYDKPDIYYVSTPYVNGTLTWVGDPQNGHFIFTKNSGSHAKEYGAKIINYDVNNEKFTIKLEDGTILLFEKAQTRPNEASKIYASTTTPVEGRDCTISPSAYNPDPLPDTWYLTKVLYNDYVDGSVPADNDPLNSKTTNKGAWFCFAYDSIVTFHANRASVEYSQVSRNSATEAQRGIEVYQDNKYHDPGYQGPMEPFCHHATNKPSKEYILRKIISPNQSAEFLYTQNRQDDFWFRKVLDSVNVSGRWDCYVRGERPVNRNVLDKINVLSNNGDIVSTITFSTGYDLRPHTMHSFAPNGKSLTLRSVTITDNLFTNYTINFDYVSLNPDGWGQKRVTHPQEGYNRNSIQCYLEERDLWGFYCRNTGFENNFNNYQNQNMAEYTDATDNEIHPYAEAWSLRKITFPTGKSIEWKYESNRYDAVNGVQNIGNHLYFGGGVRVKKLIEKSSNPATEHYWNYFYTDMSTTGVFEETSTNSSGHATIMPQSILVSVDPRSDAAKGGLYTTAAVLYERIIVVPQYTPTPPTGTTNVPLGYTVYDNCTSREHPNKGAYGEIDNNWARGFLLNTSVYNSANILLSKQEPKYECIQSGTQWDNVDDSTGFICAGIVRIDTVKSYSNGLNSTQISKYPDQINGTSVSGKLAYGRNQIFGGYENEMPIGHDGIGNSLCLAEIPSQSGFDIIMFSHWRLREVLSSPPYYLSHYRPKLNGFSRHQEKNNSSFFANDYSCVMDTFTDPVDEHTGRYILGGAGVFQLKGGNTPDLVIAWQRPWSTWDLGGPHTVYKKMITIYWDLDSNRLDDIELNPFTIGKCAFVDVDNDGVRDLVSFHSGNLVDIVTNLNGTVQIRNNLTTTSSIGNNVFLSGVPYETDRIYDDIIGIAGTTLKSTCKVFKKIRISGTTITFDEEIVISGPSQYKTDIQAVCGITWLPDIQKPVYMLKNMNHRGICIVGHEDQVGQPYRVYNKNSDGKIIASETYRAYDNPVYKNAGAPTLWDKHMLTQSSGSRQYYVTQVDNQPIGNDRVVNATAATWDKSIMNQWFPKSSYLWKATLGTTGLPGTSFIPFDYASATNTDWLFTGGATRFGKYSSALESINSLSKYNTAILGHGGSYPIGSIANAKFEECGVFTCDYDNVENSFFDMENGWRRGDFNEENPRLTGAESRVCEEARHFGKKGVKVTNAFGPSRVFKLEKGKDYILSAWIQNVNGIVPLREHMVMGVDYRQRKNAEGVWPIEVYSSVERTTRGCSGKVTAKPYGNWNYVEMKIPASEDINEADWNAGYQFASVWVGVPHGAGNQQSATVYIDDIRFYPSKSLVATTYYDTYTLSPILTVDANNNPGNQVVYDGFGRPIEIWKLTNATFNNPQQLSQQEYYVMNGVSGSGTIKIITPNGGESLLANHTIRINWWNKSLGDISIYFRKTSETNERLIKIVKKASGYGSIEWRVPANIGGDYEFKVVNSNGNSIDVSDGIVRIYDTPAMPPLNGSISFLTNNEVKLSWQGDSRSDRYEIFMGANGATPTLQGTVTTASFVANFSRNQNYTWYVKAYNTFGTGQSVNWNFSTVQRQFVKKSKNSIARSGGGGGQSTYYDIVDGLDTYNYYPGESVNFSVNCKLWTVVGPYGNSETGYKFLNWTLESGSVTILQNPPNPNGSFIMQDGNVTVQADYTTTVEDVKSHDCSRL